jgi:hypothetical protein
MKIISIREFLTAFILMAYITFTPLVAKAIDTPQQESMAAQVACNPAIQSCVSTPTPTKECDVRACMTAADRTKYEKENDCAFLPNGCQGMDSAKQCCSKDETTGKSKPVDKQITTIGDKYDWSAYQKQCPQMKQSESPPDGLWAQCAVGRPHDPTDDKWNIVEVISNGSARSFCVDGCSTPQAAIDAAIFARIFLVNDKDNPIGHPNSSFYEACKAHDICYQSCNKTSQATCDVNLRDASLAKCNNIPVEHTTSVPNYIGNGTTTVNTRQKCVQAANKMHQILSPFNNDEVGGGGATAFKKRRQQMCQCC